MIKILKALLGLRGNGGSGLGLEIRELIKLLIS